MENAQRREPAGRHAADRAGQPLRIAVVAYELVTPRQRTGGVSHYNHRLCTKLAEMGHEVTAYTMNSELDDANYRIVSVYRKRDLNSRFSRYYLAPLKGRGIDFSPYDLVISSGDDWAMRTSGKTWVRIMHGSALRELQNNRRLLRRLNLSVLYLLERLSFRKSTVTLFNSQDTGRLYNARSQDRVLSLPVDRNVFHPGKKEERPTVLFVGALDSRKRGRMLRDLFVRTVRDRVPGAQLWMVCEPDEPMDGVTYYRNLPVEELASLYRRAHVFCMPSTYEGFGLPYLEALASGTLVVSTPNPGANEVLHNGKYGLITGDEQLAETLTGALLHPERYAEMVRQGLAWADRHSWENVAAEYLAYAKGGLG